MLLLISIITNVPFLNSRLDIIIRNQSFDPKALEVMKYITDSFCISLAKKIFVVFLTNGLIVFTNTNNNSGSVWSYKCYFKYL